MKTILMSIALAVLFSSAIWAVGSSDAPPVAVIQKVTAHPDEHLRIEGERRFQANCGRCHMAPQKFPPRMMATIVRHMRVRATLTDEDMRSILYYMTQ
jgi:mono/diheme cytochrome c family protein